MLRIEDTDTERNRPEWTDGILSALRWIGVDWDEGPEFQSARIERHQEAARSLYERGLAYYCDCTRDQIDARTKGNATPGYDGFCRDRGLEPAEGRALRFRTPREGATTVVDLIRGNPVFELRTLEDFVVLRGNGTPMFLLANVVDDIDMGITHVIRGEEHLPNTPKAQLLWEALDGGPLPTWAHVPVLVNDKRQKLSKRRDKVALEEYRDEGYLAEAMRNYLMLLGWSPKGDDEIVPWSRIVEEFRLERRRAFAGVLRREEADGVQQRLHPHAHRRRVRGRGRAVGRGPRAGRSRRVRGARAARAGAGEGPVRGAVLRRVLRRGARRPGRLRQGHEGALGRRWCSTR